ncbi:MAG: DNA polymerase III subunit alpha, partial [Planctomycetota bacterium]|nr:DNA polymerase III subunit alpha [Planctomycetota bacterium]
PANEYAYNHLVLLARNFAGYQNLSRLCSEGFLTGFYRYPRIDKEILGRRAEGLVGLSGCLRGEIPQLLLAGRTDEAERAVAWYREVFGEGNFFLEIMDNGLADQKKLLPPMRELSKKTGVPLVATADVHYLRPEDKDVQDVMICINTGRLLGDENRLRADVGCHLKSGEEMLAALPEFEDAIRNTGQVVELCDLELPLNEKKFHLPRLDVPEGLTPLEYMTRISLDGLRRRYGDPLPAPVRERFESEAAVISRMGFSDYFLIVWDVVNFARENGIPVGPGRGSAAGSIVAYGLGITSLDPLKYGLFFERFLNEGRNEMPDIDLDFDMERRQEVVAHIIQRHGAGRCAKIITFNCLSLKSGIRDVGRVMGMPLSRADKLAKMIPNNFKPEKGIPPLQAALAVLPELEAEYRRDPETRRLLDCVGQLEGVMRNPGVHAAGVLVADRDITDYAPLASRAGEVTTQYEMKSLEKLGLCKIDVLGLETLSLIKNAVATIGKNHGIGIDMDDLPLDDKPTFDMLSRGDAKGVFQFESEGMRQLLSRLKPDVFEDLIAAVAIYRPGPMQFLDSFVNRKHRREPISYPNPRMEPILRETYGLILYQEQVQALAQDLAHFSLSEGDSMRRAMGKKDARLMNSFRSKFIGQAGVGIGKETAEAIYDQIEHFAGYGFNKSHSACYALIAYQTAYLKCHFPRDFMAATLTINRGDSDEIAIYIQDSVGMGIPVLPVDVNRSEAFFSVEAGGIRFGLAAVKGIGDQAALAIENERRRGGGFGDLFDFTSRIDSRAINKGAIEALIKAGAMDGLGSHRAALLAGLETAMKSGSAEQRSRNNGQLSLFGNAGDAGSAPVIPKAPAWTDRQKLQFEKESLGFYLTSHPLAEHTAMLRNLATASIGELDNLPEGTSVVVGGVISGIKQKNDKKGRPFANIVLEDMEKRVNGVIYSGVFDQAKAVLALDELFFIEARTEKYRDATSLIVDSVIPLESAEEELVERVTIKLAADIGEGDERIAGLLRIVGKSPGKARLFFRLLFPGGWVEIRAGDNFRVRPDREMRQAINALLGAGSTVLAGRGRLA